MMLFKGNGLDNYLIIHVKFINLQSQGVVYEYFLNKNRLFL